MKIHYFVGMEKMSTSEVSECTKKSKIIYGNKISCKNKNKKVEKIGRKKYKNESCFYLLCGRKNTRLQVKLMLSITYLQSLLLWKKWTLTNDIGTNNISQRTPLEE